MDEKVVNNLKSESRWLRLAFMLVFAVVAYLAAFVVVALAFAQTVHGFFTGEANQRLIKFSASVNQYIFQITSFLTYNSDVKPFPFSDWPISPEETSESAEQGSKANSD